IAVRDCPIRACPEILAGRLLCRGFATLVITLYVLLGKKITSSNNLYLFFHFSTHQRQYKYSSISPFVIASGRYAPALYCARTHLTHSLRNAHCHSGIERSQHQSSTPPLPELNLQNS